MDPQLLVNNHHNHHLSNKIMVFRPTLEEMKDFSKYIEYMESQGAHLAGLAKIIPPPEWIPRKSGYENINVTIKCPIEQVVTGSQGVYQQYNIQRRSMNFRDFAKMANSPRYCTPEFFDYDDLERKYWKNTTYNPAIYGADVPGTLTDPDCKEFNINNLDTILDLISNSYGVKIMGVNTAYLYFGMWKSSFAWHTEDMDLYSINYLHFGAPKSWYCVPPSHGKKIERMANELFKDQYNECPAFLRHKMTVISPHILRKYSIPFNKITQEQGEFMITFPYSYHAGYNHGLNCAESTNFALPRWIEFGKRATVCRCRNDTVKINMDVFVKLFQPDRYQLWLDGKDIGPDPKDPSNVCAAPSPFELEMENRNKPKRQPYKRQLVASANGSIELECLDDEETNQCEEDKNHNSPDYCYENENGFYEKPYKPKHKRLKLNGPTNNENNLSYENNQMNLLSNNAVNSNNIDTKVDKDNRCDNQQNGTNIDHNDDDKSMFISNKQNQNRFKLLTYSTEYFDSKEPVKSLKELSQRNIQYIENPDAFNDEIKLNYYTSLIEPFCSICTIFRMFEIHRDLTKLSLNLKLPNCSQVLIPKSLIQMKSKEPTTNHNLITNNNNRINNRSSLLICIKCKLCVHSCCYGVNDETINDSEWKCDRCLAENYEAACCLCPMRGGALKSTTCNQWVHLTCALVIPNIKIENETTMQPIDISNIQAFLESNRAICCFCQQRSNNGYMVNYIIGCCVRCNNGMCSEYFHVTCAYREGVAFELNDNQSSIRMTCKKCQMVRQNRIEKDMSSVKSINNNIFPSLKLNNSNEIDLDMMVVAKFDNHCYSYAKVIDKYEELFHHVQFVDNTMVNTIRSNDILNRDCEKDRPVIGDPVEVIWNKEQLHGKYVGCHIQPMFNVVFENDIQVAVNREDVYLLTDELPKRIQLKFIENIQNYD
ncbi:putative lysine-specific demethylase 4B [Sarcoptes scabiei]|uniref:[histone H3]-trimethyl-L-lysine(9) demethylase n=1 Tax=Sarcoptes scabiei TaxID=52283 RepID=A0A834R8B0_SARSC|nr:putative lysine-specific demethylase 4B [Sarcoptes scabiei]